VAIDSQPGDGKKKRKWSNIFFLLGFFLLCEWLFEYVTGYQVPSKYHWSFRPSTPTSLWAVIMLAGIFLALGCFAKGLEADE
jgi:hypothetical protein